MHAPKPKTSLKIAPESLADNTHFPLSTELEENSIDDDFNGSPSAFDPEQFEFQTPSMVRLRCSQILPLLEHAIISNKSWPTDFADDPIDVSEDLYHVLLSYQQIADRQVA
jgi:hypothetical protein